MTVFGDMALAAIVGILLTPSFYVNFQRFRDWTKTVNRNAAEHSGQSQQLVGGSNSRVDYILVP